MGLFFVGRAVGDVDAAAIGFPAGDAGGESLVGVSDAAVVLFLEFVFDGVRGGVAAQPELFDELLALFIGLQAFERGALFVGDDVGHVFIEPFAVRRLELFAQFFVSSLLFFVG